MSRVYQVNSRVARPRMAAQSPGRSLASHGRTSSAASNALVRTTTDVALSTHRVSGRRTEEEVRERQMLKYSEDKLKFQQKEKEKADRKRAEKFERYSHIDLGQRVGSLQDNIGGNDNHMMSVREQQATQYANSSPNALRIEREREEMRAKREEKKREERLKKYPEVTTGQRLSQDYIPTPSSSSSQEFQNTSSSSNTAQGTEKEEEFRRQMRENRAKIQKQYDEKAKGV